MDPTLSMGDAAEPQRVALTIEGYQIVRELHRGGQGVVYEALQRSTKRKVAIKVLLAGVHASKAARRRFEREIDLVAQLRHPNIITVFDSGSTSDGNPYCVMDYIRGRPLHEYVREKKLTLEDTLKLFATVCEAVQHAHQKGVIHRDLKPSNILVDAEGRPKVLDFGLAKQLAAPVDTLVTVSQDVIGTLPYMSPEQARGNPEEIDTRTDTYALGVILYELLTGHYPYQVVGQVAHVLREIAETAPTPPTKAWSPHTGVSQRSKRPSRPGRCPIDEDVETIVLRTLSKERERRYQSAGELARDVGHYLADEPIEARRDSGWYLLKKTVRRHRVPVALAVVGLALVVGFMAIVWTLHSRQSRERQRAVTAQQREEVRALLSWLASEPTERDGPDALRFKTVLADSCDRLRSGEGTTLDQQAFFASFLTIEFNGRHLVDVDDVAKLRLRKGTRPHWRDVADGLGMLITSHVSLDGVPVSYEGPSGGALFWTEDSGVNRSMLNSLLSAVDVGAHRLHGHVTVQIVETMKDRYDGWPFHGSRQGEDYLLIPGAVLDEPISAFGFTVVDEYPENYPPRIVDADMARKIAEAFEVQLQHCEAPSGSPTFKLILTLPVPKMTIACEVSFSIDALLENYSLTLIASREGWESMKRPLDGSVGGSGRSWIREPDESRYSIVWTRFSPERECGVSVGDTIGFQLVSSEKVARDDPTVSEYLDLGIERSVKISRCAPDD